MIQNLKPWQYNLVYWAFIIFVFGSAYFLGYHNSPGPYLPSEDSYDYRNHHCVPVAPSDYNPTEVWGN